MYARVEDLHEDSLYFLLRAGLLGRVDQGKKLNSKHAATNTEQRWRADTHADQTVLIIYLYSSFWRSVDPALIPSLDEDWSYKSDFEMFNYSVAQYVQTLGLGV